MTFEERDWIIKFQINIFPDWCSSLFVVLLQEHKLIGSSFQQKEQFWETFCMEVDKHPAIFRFLKANKIESKVK